MNNVNIDNIQRKNIKNFNNRNKKRNRTAIYFIKVPHMQMERAFKKPNLQITKFCQKNISVET